MTASDFKVWYFASDLLKTQHQSDDPINHFTGVYHDEAGQYIETQHFAKVIEDAGMEIDKDVDKESTINGKVIQLNGYKGISKAVAYGWRCLDLLSAHQYTTCIAATASDDWHLFLIYFTLKFFAMLLRRRDHKWYGFRWSQMEP